MTPLFSFIEGAFSPSHILIVLVVGFILFGKKFPEMGRMLDPGSGNGIAQNEDICYSPQTSQDEGRPGGSPWRAQRRRW
jgi:hypothetical protein